MPIAVKSTRHVEMMIDATRQRFPKSWGHHAIEGAPFFENPLFWGYEMIWGYPTLNSRSYSTLP